MQGEGVRKGAARGSDVMGVNRSLLFGERHLLECSGPQRSVSRFSLGDAAPLRQALVVRAALEKQPRPSWSRAAGACRVAGLCPRDSASTWQQQQQRLWLGFPQSACKSHVFGGRVKLPLWDFCMGCWARGDSSLTAARVRCLVYCMGAGRGGANTDFCKECHCSSMEVLPLPPKTFSSFLLPLPGIALKARKRGHFHTALRLPAEHGTLHPF